METKKLFKIVFETGGIYHVASNSAEEAIASLREHLKSKQTYGELQAYRSDIHSINVLPVEHGVLV